MDNLEPWPNAWEVQMATMKHMVDPLPDVMREYYKVMIAGDMHIENNKASDLKFTYTPMHGVGQKYMVEAFSQAGFKV